MKRNRLFCMIIITISGCVKPFEPPEIKANNNFLVVEGIINAGPGSITTITVSRTRRLNDSVLTILPERYAQVMIEREDGMLYPLNDNQNGIFTSGPLNLPVSEKYRLKIITAANKKYLSDFVTVKQTPPIDSVFWEKNDDLKIFLTTHDPQNNTRYYRWDYTETWEHHSYFDSNLGYANGQLYYRDSTNSLFKCWNTLNSTDILLGTTVTLNDDVIERMPITFIPAGSHKLGIKYSILVRQYALTREAYEYWEILKKNTQELGTLFDPQPSQLIGNIHSEDDQHEPVIGFVNASTVQLYRIFIKNGLYLDWHDSEPAFGCEVNIVGDVSYYLDKDTTLAPAYFVTGGGVAITKKPCVDCTRRGGTTVKPLFWQ